VVCFIKTYPLDSVFKSLNNWDLMYGEPYVGRRSVEIISSEHSSNNGPKKLIAWKCLENSKELVETKVLKLTP